MFNRLFAKLDLYKSIIIVCLLAMPVIGYFIWNLQQKIRTGKQAIDRALLVNARDTQLGDLEAIGMLKTQVEKLKNKPQESSAADSYRVSFQSQLLRAIPGLKVDDYTISEKRTSQLTIDKNRYATNEVVSIEFKRAGNQKYPLTRDSVFAALFNIESQTAWKLFKFRMKNKEMLASAAQKTPPPELPDEWQVETMEFSHKVPREASR